MKNKLTDLNNHLFAEIERLSDEDLKDEKLTQEVSRARAIVGVAEQIISNGRLIIDAMVYEHGVPGIMRIGLLAVDKDA
jgi:hypothetical protein